MYFVVDGEYNDYKIRVSDHDKNRQYATDVNMYIISDIEDENLVREKVLELAGIDNNLDDIKESTLNKMTDTFIKDYLTKYDGNPRIFNRILKYYNIDDYVQKFKWFREMLNNRCMELVLQYPQYRKYYENSRIYGYKIEEDRYFDRY